MSKQVNYDTLNDNYYLAEYNHEEEGGGENKTTVVHELEHEIECPRCCDVMTLSSDFDCLYYICESCDFSLYTIKRNCSQ
jgi:hypothetical protein